MLPSGGIPVTGAAEAGVTIDANRVATAGDHAATARASGIAPGRLPGTDGLPAAMNAGKAPLEAGAGRANGARTGGMADAGMTGEGMTASRGANPDCQWTFGSCPIATCWGRPFVRCTAA